MQARVKNIQVVEKYRDEIAAAARTGNDAALNKLLRFLYQDDKKTGFDRAVQLLAEEGNAGAVNQLVYHHKGSKSWAAFGYARKGYDDLLNELISSNKKDHSATTAQTYQPVDMLLVFRGYVSGQRYDDLEKLIGQSRALAVDIIDVYVECGELSRAEALRDALKMQSSLSDLSKITDKYSNATVVSPEQARQSLSLFHHAYANINRHEYSAGIDHVGTDLCESGEKYLRAFGRN